MERKVIQIIIAMICFIIIAQIFGMLYLRYISINGSPYERDIKDIDEDRRFSKPYAYITPISSTNVSSVEDLFLPKFFYNDNITVYFPEGDKYMYGIGIRPEDPSGSLIIYSSNGSELDHSKWSSGAGSLGGGIYSSLRDFDGGESLCLNFSGSGIVIFLSLSASEMFGNSSDYSGIVGSDLIAFYLPIELTDNLPPDRRIEARISSINGSPFKVRYYDENLHLLVEAEGTKKAKTQIPSGGSIIVIAVVESEGEVLIKFGYTSHIPGERNFTDLCLLSGLIISLIIIVMLAVKIFQIFREEKQSKDNNGRVRKRNRKQTINKD